MVWWPFATKLERADTTEAADLNCSRLHSTRRFTPLSILARDLTPLPLRAKVVGRANLCLQFTESLEAGRRSRRGHEKVAAIGVKLAEDLSHAIGTSRQAASILCSQKGLAIMLANYTSSQTKCKV